MSVKQTTVYTGPGYPLDPAKDFLREPLYAYELIAPKPDSFYSMLLAQMDHALERQRQDFHFSRTIRRVETIVNFKDEFGCGDRPEWSEFVSPDRIWRRYARQDKSSELAAVGKV